MKSFQEWVIFLFIAILSFQVHAVDNLKFSGTLIEPPLCKVSDSDKINVDFKQVGVKKVDGVNNLMLINYQLNCEKSSSSDWSMTLEVVGVAIDYDRAAIKTNVDDLGIRIYQDDKPFELNKPIPISLDKQPVLKAVPVKRPGSSLQPKPFSATATLLVVYQ